MENTVTISLKEYNELINLKLNIDANKILCYSIKGYKEFVTEDEAMQIIAKDSKELYNQNIELSKEVTILKKNNQSEFIKKTTLWQFYKLKRKK